MRRMFAGLLAIISLMMSAHVMAHHSTAMYDYKQSMRLTGVVSNFEWTNPHCFLQLLVTKDGSEAEWAIETGTPTISARLGWTKNSLKSGDKVTVEISPLRDGGHGGTLRTVTLPDGKVLKGAALALAANEGAPAP